MTTVLTVGNSEGSRRCDARCHDADGGTCACCCGGRYHGSTTAVVLDRVRSDVEAGVFGEVVSLETPRQTAMHEKRPELSEGKLRFHADGVRRAVRRVARDKWRRELRERYEAERGLEAKQEEL